VFEKRPKSYIRYNTRTLEVRVKNTHLTFHFLLFMVTTLKQEVVIVGITKDGKAFRPSDWAERLAGVMSSFRPGGALPGDHISYSPWCVPNTIDGNKCVIVHQDLKEAEPMAWDFVMNFAKDNNLQVS
jgi:hypothetical protein